MAVDAIVTELVRHDSPSGISNQDVDLIGALCDFVGRSFDCMPVGHVALEPSDAFCSFFSHLFADGFERILDDILGHGNDVKALDILFEKSMGASIANSYTGSDFTGTWSERQYLVSLQL